MAGMERLLCDVAPSLRSTLARAVGGSGALDARDQVAQGGELGVERAPARLGGADPRPGPAAIERLLDPHVPRLLEDLEVARQVAVGEAERFLQVPEVGLVGFGQDGKDPEAHPLMDDIVEALRRVGVVTHGRGGEAVGRCR